MKFDISLDKNESKSSNVDELNQHEAEVDLVKFKTFVETNIVKLKCINAQKCLQTSV